MQSFKFLLILFIVFSSSCQPAKKSPKKIDLLLSLIVIDQTGLYDTVACQKKYNLNAAYVSGGYAERFSVDLKQYENVAITDSTWDISRNFPSFHNSEITQMNSVAGDTLCDFNSRFRRSIKTLNPKTVIVSSIGGNDFLKGFDDQTITETFQDFYIRLVAKFPTSYFVFVQVHRVKLDHINVEVNRVTPQLKLIAPNVCWVDPSSCFSNPVKDSEFLPGDSIHYSQASALCIKEKIKSTCGVTF